MISLNIDKVYYMPNKAELDNNDGTYTKCAYLTSREVKLLWKREYVKV